MLPPGLEAIRQQIQDAGRAYPLTDTILQELEFIANDAAIQQRLRERALGPGPAGGYGGGAAGGTGGTGGTGGAAGRRCTLCGCDPANCT